MIPVTSPIGDGGTRGGPARRRARWLRGDEGFDPSQGAVRLLAAVLITVAAVAFKLAVIRGLGVDLGYLSYLGAVALGAWIAGFRGGLVTTAVCAAAELVLHRGLPETELTTTMLLGLGVFLFDGVLVTLIASGLRRAMYRERAARVHSEELLEGQSIARATSEQAQAELAGLQAVTASLAGAATPTDVADAILDRGLNVLGAIAGGVSRLDPPGAALELIASRGYPEPGALPGHRFVLDRPTPLRDAMTTGRPVLLGDVEEWRSRYPASPPVELPGTPSEGAIAVLPLVAAGRTLGAAVFRFDREVDFAGGTGALAVRLAEHGALALDRAIAYDGEHRARLDLERGQDRLAFLVLASHRLAARSDIGSSLSDVADLAVPRLADWCAIEVSDLDLPILAIAPGDRRAAIARLGSLAPWSLGHWLVPGLTRDGVALLTAERAWPGGPADPGVGATLRDLSTRALLAAVITGDDGAPIGSILLGATDENRFMPTDVSLVRDLADRVATAVRETRLFAAVARFKATVDQSADAVFMFDPHTLRLTYVNRGGADLAGREPAALMDRSILELQPDGTGSGFQRLITDRPGGQPGGPLAHRSAILRADGREVPIEAVVQEVTLGDGSTSVILTARDISDRIDVQARLTRIAGDERRQAAELRAVLQAMGEGILVVGPHGSISLANETAIAILGADMPADLGELLRRLGLGTAELRNEELEAGAAAAGAEPRVARLEDGRWLEIASYPAELGSTMGDEPTSSIVVIRDVTRAKEADAAQEAFLGVLSHELRTPVTTIYGYSKMLQRPTRDEDRAEMLSDIEVEADRLYRIVEDLLALSRVEGGISIDGEPLLVQHLVGPVVASEAQRWLSTRFEIDLPPGLPPVFGERTYVEQVVRNLVSNAGKYGRAGSVATVTAEATPTEVLVRVLDRGIGIQAGEAERLFDLYYRSPNSARSATGAGIGLYVGRGLVTAMGGRIWARPRVGGGSEFGFSLPRCEEDAMPAGEADRAR